MSPAIPTHADLADLLVACERAGLEATDEGAWVRVEHAGRSATIQRSPVGRWEVRVEGRSPSVHRTAAKALAAARYTLSTIAAEAFDRERAEVQRIIDLLNEQSTLDTTRALASIERHETAEETMRPTTTATLTDDAREAATRTAARQLVKLTRDPLVGLLQRHLAPGDDAFRARLAAFLETELGTAVLASLLSVGIGSIPSAPPQAGTLARELRVQGMALASDTALDVLLGPLREVVRVYLQDPSGIVAALPSGEGVERLETEQAREAVR